MRSAASASRRDPRRQPKRQFKEFRGDPIVFVGRDLLFDLGAKYIEDFLVIVRNLLVRLVLSPSQLHVLASTIGFPLLRAEVSPAQHEGADTATLIEIELREGT